jgi:hypothetical protein
MSMGKRLRKAGFDLSEYDKSNRTWWPRCSQCNALVIQGIACHERGCPNDKKT